MDEITQNILGFHTNEKIKCENGLKNIINLISKDKDWLGEGIYFWDNISNAKYWSRKKKREHRNKEILILKGNIYLDCILDLTDKEAREEFNTLWLKCLKSSNDRDKLEKYPLGERINYIFELYGSIVEEEVKVIKAIGIYRNSDRLALFENVDRHLLDDIEGKIIYCVRGTEKIVNLRIHKERGV